MLLIQHVCKVYIELYKRMYGSIIPRHQFYNSTETLTTMTEPGDYDIITATTTKQL